MPPPWLHFSSTILFTLCFLTAEESPKMFDLYIQETLEDMDRNEDAVVTIEEYIGASIIVNN